MPARALFNSIFVRQSSDFVEFFFFLASGVYAVEWGEGGSSSTMVEMQMLIHFDPIASVVLLRRFAEAAAVAVAEAVHTLHPILAGMLWRKIFLKRLIWNAIKH